MPVICERFAVVYRGAVKFLEHKVPPPLFVLYINRFQIAPEERVMASLFGADYAAYKERVRRWI